MGQCLSLCGDEDKPKYVKHAEQGIALQAPPQTPQTTRDKQQHREAGWQATGIIGLRDQQLTVLPISIISCPTAKVLDASNNRLKELPASLGMLTSLQRLVLSSNALSSFPGGIAAALSSLKILNLDHNQLQVLPAELCQLAKLEKLYASHNSLRELPSMLDQLPKLQVLVVSHNQLTQLPEGLPGVLEECNVANNAITVIPAGLGRLQQLKIFNLDNNRVRRRQKYDRSIAGGVMLGSRGLDEGVDRNAPRCCLGLVALPHPHAACVSKVIVELGGGSRLRPLQAEAPPFMHAVGQAVLRPLPSLRKWVGVVNPVMVPDACCMQTVRRTDNTAPTL
ncbi:predicted protein [Haematococcus lacustris]|uniref:Uncharacterized protein n=1 Tax=Haematococcus lacustris TaxID=44745 RepID=A0A699Z6N8_HAELA|nr:predicted protein [Haematococcus lacustris]